MNVLSFSHQRAERLIDDRLDQERGEGRLDPSDAAWLDAHLASCDRCQVAERDRRRMITTTRALGRVSAPDGFAARVLAAKERGDVPVEPPALGTNEVLTEVPGHARRFSARDAVGDQRRPMVRFAMLAAVAAAALGAFVAIGTDSMSTSGVGGVGVSGTGALEQSDLHPDFVVRAPGLGPAKARAQVVSIIEAHGGRYEVSTGALFARIPRDELVGVMRDLSKQSRYKVARSDGGELDRDMTEVTIKFELE